MDEFYTVKELASKLKVSDQQIYDLIKEGKITPTYVGEAIRISSEEYLRFIGKNGNSKDN
jgi:excisionase family DNA binding protein